NLRRLKSPHWETRLLAAGALGESRSARAVKGLVAALRDKQPHVAEAAVLGLGKIGGLSVVGPLIEMLVDERLWMREAASAALEKADPRWHESPAAQRAVPLLLGALASEEPDIRAAAEEVLGNIGDHRAVEPMVVMLRHRGEVTIVQALGRIRSRSAIEPLIGRLADPRPWMQQAAEAALKSIDRNWGRHAAVARAVSGFVATLQDRSKSSNLLLRTAAALALGKLRDRSAIEPLLAALKEGGYVSHAAEQSLRLIDPNWQQLETTRRMVPVFTALLKNKDLEVRLGAVEELSKIGGAGCIAPLAEMLVDANARVRQAAAQGLGKLDANWAKSGRAAPAVPRLAEALKSRNSEVQDAAATALAKIGATAAVDALVAAYGSSRSPALAQALGKLGSAKAVEPLIAALGSPSFYVRMAAERALNTIAPEWSRCPAAKRAVPAFCQALLETPDHEARQAAAEALGKIGDPSAMEALLRARKEDNEMARKAVFEALRKIRKLTAQ
ncbi:MAG: HEAT repeat domain-containing protein, partial [Terriglobales bacterium]